MADKILENGKEKKEKGVSCGSTAGLFNYYYFSNDRKRWKGAWQILTFVGKNNNVDTDVQDGVPPVEVQEDLQRKERKDGLSVSF